MSERRTIRLKESTPHSDRWRTPTKGYLDGTDGSLGEGPWRLRTDEHGFIETGNQTSPDWPGIVFLGDSFVESTFSPESDRFVSRVERHLNGEGTNVRCLNGGYSGSTTLQLFNVLINKVIPLVGRGGTVVFFIPIASDLPIYFRPHSYWYPTDRFAPLVPPFTPPAPDLPRGVAALESLLRLVISAAEEFDINLVLITSPHRHAERGQDAYLDRILTEAQANSLATRRRDVIGAAISVAEATGVKFLDAASAFVQHPDKFYDEVHLNDQGQEWFAEWLHAELGPLLQHLHSGLSEGALTVHRV